MNTQADMLAMITGPQGQLEDLQRRARLLENLGAPIPEPYTRSLAAWQAVKIDQKSTRDALLQAIAEGRVDDVPGAALTAAISGGTDLAPLVKHISADVTRLLWAQWRTGSQEAYDYIATLFDEAGGKLAECISAVDVLAAAESIVSASSKARAAWQNAPLASAQLDEFMPALVAAAQLTGLDTKHLVVDGEGAHSSDWWLPLCCEPKGQIREVWAAWESSGRCGRWAALAKVATVKAAADLKTIQPYRRAKPIVTEYKPVGRGTYMPVTTDPEKAAVPPGQGSQSA